VDWARFRVIADKSAHFSSRIIGTSPACGGKATRESVPFCGRRFDATHKLYGGPARRDVMCKEKFASAIDKAGVSGRAGGPHDHINPRSDSRYGEALKPEFGRKFKKCD